MVETVYPRIRAAIDTVDRELEFTAEERQAFERFRSRLAAVAPRSPTDAGSSAGPAILAGGDLAGSPASSSGGQSPAPSLQAVRTAYRETVMAVPHFEAEYDETLRENLAAEFGADIAARVCDGRDLTPPLREVLQTATGRAITERERFEAVLARERRSLEDVRRELDDHESRAYQISSAIDEATASEHVSELDDQLAGLEQACAGLARDRQQLLTGRTIGPLSVADEVSLTEFLYADHSTPYPALSAITDCLETVRHLRRRCLR